MKAASGKLALSAAILRKATEDLGIRTLPYTADHAFRMFGLACRHNRPFDRQIIAQAWCEDLAVVAPEDQFRR